MPFWKRSRPRQNKSNVPPGSPLESAQSTSSSKEVPKLGLLELSQGVNPVVDIVAVHGLNGHREKTWTKGGVNWLKDLLPRELPNSRVFSWGYDANTHGTSPATVQLLYNHGIALVADLSRRRQLTETERRPIIFVAHSLGGIVVKSALIHAAFAREDHLKAHRAIKISTYGLFFLGTPHQGTDKASWGEILVSVASIFIDTNRNLLQHLKRDSEALQQQLEQFTAISNDFVTKFAYEAYPMIIAGKRILIVPQPSAVVPGYRDAEEIAIMADHRDMVKFSSGENEEFRKVSETLILMARESAGKIETNWSKQDTLDKALLDAEPSKENFNVSFDLTGVPAIQTYVGRETEIRKLKQYLLPSANPVRRKVFVIHGLGGIGKTQLAIQFARKFQESFTAIFWLDGKSRDTLLRSLAAVWQKLHHTRTPTSHFELSRTLGRAAGYETSFEEAEDFQEQDARKTLNWLALKENCKWLLIFDNIDKEYSFGNRLQPGFGVESFFPATDQGSIIITTRLKHLEQLGESLKLRTLDQQDALLVLAGNAREHATTLQDNNTNTWYPETIELIQKLDGLALAIAIAGSYISRTGVSVSEYIELYTQSWTDLQQSASPGRHYHNGSLATTWIISYEAVKRENVIAAKLLQLLACFANRDLWFGLLTCDDHGVAPEWFQTVVSSKIKFYDLVGILKNYSLVEAEENNKQSYSIHPTVQDWCREYLNKDDWDEFVLLGLTSVGGAIPIDSKLQDWMLRQRLLPHANQLLDLVGGRFWEGFLKNPSIHMVETVNSLGTLYFKQRKLQEAEAMFQRALVGKEKVLGSGHPSTLNTVDNLGLLYSDQGKLQEAEAMFQRVLAAEEKALGPDHPSTLNVVNSLGSVYQDQSKPQEAEAMFQRALAGLEKALGPDHPWTADTVNNLGHLYMRQGKTQEAEAMLQRALEAEEKALGPDHPTTLNTFRNLSLVYMCQGKLQEAECMLQRVLAESEKALGPDHPWIVYTVNNLGLLYMHQAIVSGDSGSQSNQRKLQEAESMLQRALVENEKTQGLDHPSTLYTVNNLGLVYMHQGKLEEAEAMLQRALAGNEKAHGPGSLVTLKISHDLGLLYMRTHQGKLQEAEAMLQRALAGMKKVLGPNHPSTLNIVNSLDLLNHKKLREAGSKTRETKFLLDRPASPS